MQFARSIAGGFFLLTLWNTGALAASCPAPKFTEADNVFLTGESALIVTHPSTIWDGHYTSKLGMDAAVRIAKAQNIPVVYLAGNSEPESYFFSDCNPKYWVSSSGGEFSFKVPVKHVYSVGGHWEYCQKTTMADLMEQWSGPTRGDLKVTQVLDGLYTMGDTVRRSDSYYDALTQFIKMFDAPGVNARANMFQVQRLVNDEAKFIELLKRNLPPYQRLHSEYRVELILNGKKIEDLQAGTGATSPVLTLEFVDTLYDGGVIPAAHHYKTIFRGDQE